MTPSQWHDDARNRDAGHDDMQIAIFDYLRDLPAEREAGVRQGVWFEHPFARDGRVVAWADILEVWDPKPVASGTYPKPKQRYVIFEVKPKIYSVGAVIRQCEALEIAISATFRARTDGGPDIKVMPIVKHDDPKLSALRHVYHAIAWNGERLT